MVEVEGRRPQEQSFDQAELSFEHRLLQSELISSRQVTLRKVLKSKRKEDPAGLLDIPANFQVRDLGASLIHIVSFSENQASFGGERFIQVLTAAKPVRIGMSVRSQDKDGIVADWRMLKEDVRIQKSSSQGYNSLYKEHTTPTSPITRKLGEHFREIGENHFGRFWDAIYSDSNDKTAETLKNQFSYLMSEEKALAMYGLDFLRSSFGGFLAVIDSSFLFRDALGQFLKRETNITIPDLSGDFRFCSMPSALFDRTFKKGPYDKLIADFYKQLDDDKRKKLIYQTVSLFNFPMHTNTILVDHNGNPHDMYDDNLLSKPSRTSVIRKLPNGELEIREGEFYIRVVFVRDEKTGFREPRLVEKYLSPQKGEISPVIIWETDKITGRRKYFCGNVTPELIKAFPDLFSSRHDTLLGQIAVAAYSENLKTSLPTKLSLVKGGVMQDMLEAQMLAFPKLFSGAYLKRSPVILGLEDLAHKK